MTSPSPQWMIEASELSKTYQKGRIQVRALKSVSFNVFKGEFLALMGPSGSGKSTLLHLLGCLDTPTSGVYRLAGKDVSRISRDERTRIRNQQIGFVFQSFNLLPRASAWENVALPLLYRQDRKSRKGSIKDQAILQLEKVGLRQRAEHHPAELSGGESQRVAIARALITSPDLLLADEPTGNLDHATGEEILEILAAMNGEGHTVLVVTHDPHVASYASRVLVLSDGKVVREEHNDAMG